MTRRLASRLGIAANELAELVRLDEQLGGPAAQNARGILTNVIRQTRSNPKMVLAFASQNVEALWQTATTLSPAAQDSFIALVRKGSGEFIDVLNKLQEQLTAYLDKNYADRANQLGAEGKALQARGQVSEGNAKIGEANRLIETFNARQTEAHNLLGQAAALFNALSESLRLPSRINQQRTESERGTQWAWIYPITQGKYSPLAMSPGYRKPNVSTSMDAAMDAAMKGGIDFKAEKMNVQVQNGGEAVKLNVNQAMIGQFEDVSGFKSVILGIEPVANLGNFLRPKLP